MAAAGRQNNQNVLRINEDAHFVQIVEANPILRHRDAFDAINQIMRGPVGPQEIMRLQSVMGQSQLITSLQNCNSATPAELTAFCHYCKVVAGAFNFDKEELTTKLGLYLFGTYRAETPRADNTLTYLINNTADASVTAGRLRANLQTYHINVEPTVVVQQIKRVMKRFASDRSGGNQHFKSVLQDATRIQMASRIPTRQTRDELSPFVNISFDKDIFCAFDISYKEMTRPHCA